MTDANLTELAKQGNAEAIATILSDRLKPEGILAQATIQDNFLEITLEAEEVPDRYELVELIRSELTELQPELIKRVKVVGKEAGKKKEDWHQEFALEVGAFSYLIVPSLETDNPPAMPPVPSETEEKEAERVALENWQLSRIVLVFVVAVLSVAVIIFIGKMVMKQPSNNSNPSAYTLNIKENKHRSRT